MTSLLFGSFFFHIKRRKKYKQNKNKYLNTVKFSLLKIPLLFSFIIIIINYFH